MSDLQSAKAVVRRYYSALDNARDNEIESVLRDHAASDYQWRGLHPFHELSGCTAVAEVFWLPFRAAFRHAQRRQDVFIAGLNTVDEGQSQWVCSMGHLMGLFDKPWLDIQPTGRIAFFRYAEFHRVDGDRIAESALFFDLISIMEQSGCYPLPPATGSQFVHPGPRTHDGQLFDSQDPEEGRQTIALINRMVADLADLNRSGNDTCPPELLAQCWHDDMVWYGPAGIGSTFTIERYQQQHQYPFRQGLKDKQFNGHVCRFAEGSYGGFFGWPNLTNTPKGGFLGLPGTGTPADMRVVDVYRREGAKLAENWVFIDLPHYLNMQGLDILSRMREQNAP